MATGKKALDIFQRTTGKRPVIGLEVAERMGRGRPGAGEPYQKVTVTLYDRQILMLDKVALAFRERTGEFTNRAELIRVIIDQAAASLNPDGPDFDKTIRALFPALPSD